MRDWSDGPGGGWLVYALAALAFVLLMAAVGIAMIAEHASSP